MKRYIYAFLFLGSFATAAGYIGNSDIKTNAAIAFSKLASLTSGNILVGSAGNVATSVAMSGEATLANTGAITLSNSAVIGKVLTGYTSGAGTVAATDSILEAIEKLNGNIDAIGGGGGGSLQSAQFVCGSGNADADTELLLTFETGSSFKDYSTNDISAWTANAGAAASGTDEKFGAASLAVNGAQYIGNNAGATPLLGAGDFTIDFWVNYSTFTGQDFACVNTNNTGAWYFSGPFSGGDLQFGNGGGSPLVSGAAPSTGAWHHIAVVRNSGTLTMYVGGTSVGSAANSTDFDATGGSLVIGACPLIFNTAAGYIDEFRISSVARWTSNFTPPAAPYEITNTITTNPGGWIDSVDGGAGPGECTVNFAGGTFSSAPVCVATPITGTIESSTNAVSASSTSAISLKSVIGGAAANNNTYMHCQ